MHNVGVTRGAFFSLERPSLMCGARHEHVSPRTPLAGTNTAQSFDHPAPQDATATCSSGRFESDLVLVVAADVEDEDRSASGGRVGGFDGHDELRGPVVLKVKDRGSTGDLP